MSHANNRSFNKATSAGFLIALGIVYGDIGTSPLYAMQAIVRGQGGLENLSENFILGAVSLIIWTLTLITTIKYVIIALRADNHHEGGIFSLFTLVRRMSKWLIIPAMVGGATLLADGALTPAVTVTSAIEGLKGVPSLAHIYSNQTAVVITTMSIIAILFLIQRFGTSLIGRLFGPIMFLWFSFLGLSGLINSFADLSILKAINPYYAISLLFSAENKAGFFILGSIFLVTTGAEALYSDLGHAGRGNIYLSWPFVKICIILSYCGQGAWLLAHRGESLALNPFFAVLPGHFVVYAVILSTFAAIIASQALISGSFTLVSEAIRLKLLPLLRIYYPGQTLGQLYIPAINFALWITTSFFVLYFRTSEHMEAAYSLAITITMLMTTTLLTYFLIQKGIPKPAIFLISFLLFVVEGSFFIASLVQFVNGAYIVVLIALMIIFVMFIWNKSHHIVIKYIKSLNLNDYKKQLNTLRHDASYDLYQTNVVYLTSRMDQEYIDRSILYSILDKRPKRAECYWFVNVKVTDEPYTAEYKVDMMDTDFIVRVNLYLGFRMRQEVPRYLRTIVTDLMESGRLPYQHQHYSIMPGRKVGDFRFVIVEEKLMNARQMPGFERFVMQTKAQIKKITASPIRWFGLQFSEVTVETVPLVLSDVRNLEIHERVEPVEQAEDNVAPATN
ncbi:KUP/HAK/KT family potassium transporter [Lactococcus kimchii]|uniref:KUP/HAK/KT family potassium transporter n=1 Tax=Lactococcus sp. S-13 TaxID=2507158 RepID=UPI001023F240|nr:potassium transporter Kup [Lactococcus sp. S-13]RZI48674.1 potassium transporter Kup [Lactococcus sp. S-13]